ncbi:MAG: helix-turn-helix domain-containing protein [Clostridiales bacterium]|jgi:DNA-binding transcriptional regulator LsrR (DeoR family)|nr:helix-turn-helix domain-containing protein [Clostridiales bacterium]
MEYLSAKEVAEKWNISRRRVQILCEEGRIQGAFKLSNVWVIPKDAEKPADKRKTRDKPVKREEDN